MMRWLVIVLGLFLPMMGFAQDSSTLSFTPPPSDLSVVFLGNIFGVVDGVLHGTGSQIMGAMFGVFNSAVLALGGIIIMYTLIVSTMNTAHEGQMLGQKFNSIWVPLRSTVGLALLIPKASGYCLMQIFVMWLTVQGIGAADMVWNAALSYLNRGGVIVQAQMNPIKSIRGDDNVIATGAAVILSGQVCMLGLQRILEQQREMYLTMREKGAGPCSGNPTAEMQTFCNTPVPDFLTSVNAISAQNQGFMGTSSSSPAPSYAVNMPNLTTAPYAQLNGICGKLTWNSMSNLKYIGDIKNELNSGEYETASMSRAMALQQMYQDLALVAQVMVSNNPGLINSSAGESTFLSLQKPPFSAVARQQFGVATISNGQACTTYSDACNGWGPDQGSKTQSTVLFNGTEFQGAVADYNSIMQPTLTLIQQSYFQKSATARRQFINQAEADGWVMAGSYFFSLARLSAENEIFSDNTDTNSGLSQNFDTDLSGIFNSDSKAGHIACPNSKYAILCMWLQNDSTKVNALMGLINGSSILTAPLSSSTLVPNTFNSGAATAETGVASSTVYGFIRNSLMVHLPGQPGIAAPSFAKMNINMSNMDFKFPKVEFGCRGYFCLASAIAAIFYNFLFRILWDTLFAFIAQIINGVVFAFIFGPLVGMSQIFVEGVSYLRVTNANPIVALATMGVNYINFSGDLWMYLVQLTIVLEAIPILGFILGAMLALVMPLLLAWLSIMVSIGFTTAYYIPIMPYIIFTFGVIGWLITVIEAMVAAPIVALGVTHPEGHESFGKGEQAIMILMNVFLRPAMMIMGYIAAIVLSYVAVWIINSGFSRAVEFIQTGNDFSVASSANVNQLKNQGKGVDVNNAVVQSITGKNANDWNQNAQARNEQRGTMRVYNSSGLYKSWAGIYGFFFVIILYVSMYLTVVQKAFTLITYLPDKILRWIGGQAEGIGAETSQWGEETKGKVEKSGEATQRAAGQVSQQMAGYFPGGDKTPKLDSNSSNINVKKG